MDTSLFARLAPELRNYTYQLTLSETRPLLIEQKTSGEVKLSRQGAKRRGLALTVACRQMR